MIRLVLLGAILLLLADPARAAVTFEVASEGNSGTALSATLVVAHNNTAVSAGDRLILFGVVSACNTACPADAGTATWNGDPMTQVAVIVAGGTKTWIFARVDPDLVNGNAVFTPSNQQRMAGVVLTFAGVSQGTPLGTPDTDSCPSATTCTSTISVPATGMGVGLGGKQNSADAIVTTTQTERGNDCSITGTTTANRCLAMSTTGTAGTQNFTFSSAGVAAENMTAIAVALNAAVSAPETFYVCQGGDGTLPETNACATAWDANDFSTAANWTTAAVTDDGKIGPGDTVIVLSSGGTLTGTEALGTLRQREAGTAIHHITVQGLASALWTVSGQSARPCIFAAGGYITFKDFRCTLGTGSAAYSTGAPTVIFEDCEVDNAVDDGIALQGDSNIVRRCYSHDNADVGIYLTGDTVAQCNNCLAEHNRVENNGMGIEVNSAGTTNQTGNIIRHNWIKTKDVVAAACFNELSGNGTLYLGNVCDCTGTAIDRAGMWIGTDGVGLAATNIDVYNNTFYCNSEYVLNVSGNSTGNEWRNNIAVQLSNDALYDVATGSAVTFDTNLLFPAQLTGFVVYQGTTYNACATWLAAAGTTDDASVCDDNPDFTSPGTDFTLTSSSPAINAGATLGAAFDEALSPVTPLASAFGRMSTVTTVDQDTLGAGWEIGAYAFAPTTTMAPARRRFTW